MIHRNLFFWSALGMVVAASGFMPAAAAEVRLLRVPEGGLQPQVALDELGGVHLLYFRGPAGAGDLYYVRRGQGEEEFSVPVRVNSQAGSATARGSIRGGQLALGRGGRPHVAWNGSNQAEPKGPGKYGNPMLYSRLSDNGEFERQRNLIGKAYGLDGGGSIAADARGNVYVAWHAGVETGETGRRIWLVASHDEGGSFEQETAIDARKFGACGCCRLKAFADSAGDVFVLYRSAREGVNRDMELLFSAKSGSEFDNVRLDSWNIATCPMSSEAFAESPDGVFAAWETAGQVMFTRIDRQSRPSKKPNSAPGNGGNRKHPALAVNRKGQLLLAWAEGTGWEKSGALAWQEFDARGKPTDVRGRREGIPVWSFPAAYADANGDFVVVY